MKNRNPHFIDLFNREVNRGEQTGRQGKEKLKGASPRSFPEGIFLKTKSSERRSIFQSPARPFAACLSFGLIIRSRFRSLIGRPLSPSSSRNVLFGVAIASCVIAPLFPLRAQERREIETGSKWNCRGIVLLGPGQPLLSSDALEQIEGLVEMGVSLPANGSILNKRLLPFFNEGKLDREQLIALQTAIYQFYLDYGDPFVVVIIPEQRLSSSVLQIRIIHSKLGELQVEGSKHSHDIARQMRIQKGEEIHPLQLEQDLNWLNRYPFQKTRLIYEAGQKPYTTDIALVVDERRGNRIYSGIDNAGVPTIRRGRMFAGFDLGGWLGFQHLFSFQYTASYSIKAFQSFTAQYIGYLPWKNVLTVYGGYSKVHTKLLFPATKNEGNSYSASLRYTIPLSPLRNFSHEFSWGADFKSTNNTIEFSQLFENYSKIVLLTQGVAGYRNIWDNGHFRSAFEAEFLFSPAQWLPHQSKANYNSLRPGATPRWAYIRGSWKGLYKTKAQWSWILDLRFQTSWQNLIPSEQIGMGGYATVRGYDQQQLNLDQGMIGNLELRTPLASLSGGSQKKIRGYFQFLGFLDYGVGWNHTLIPGEGKQQYIAGAGPGFRYTYDPWISCRFDWGIKLHNKASFTGGNYQFHFNITASY